MLLCLNFVRSVCAKWAKKPLKLLKTNKIERDTKIKDKIIGVTYSAQCPAHVKDSMNFNRNLLSPYQKPGTTGGSGDLEVTKTDKVTALPECPVWWARQF